MPRKGVFVGFMTPDERDAALALAGKLRASGESVNLSLKKLKPKQFFSRAGNSSCAKAVYLGPDDVAAGKAKMKDLDTREETEITL
jgi:histidyl-tRNA synthetase